MNKKELVSAALLSAGVMMGVTIADIHAEELEEDPIQSSQEGETTNQTQTVTYTNGHNSEFTLTTDSNELMAYGYNDAGSNDEGGLWEINGNSILIAGRTGGSAENKWTSTSYADCSHEGFKTGIRVQGTDGEDPIFYSVISSNSSTGATKVVKVTQSVTLMTMNHFIMDL